MTSVAIPSDAFFKENSDEATNTSSEKRWFSVKEAADYLGVSQPTIFRWMKEGVLSFYKVGGSTRFQKSGLDAVVEKTTGRTEAAAAAGRCASCGHTVLVDGRLQGMGKLYFKPEHTRFWTLEESLIATHAKVCPACGYIQMHADAAKLRRLQPREEALNDTE